MLCQIITSMSVRQVDISHKPVQRREAVAVGRIKLRPETVEKIRQGSVEKGNPLEVARIAGILAAKNTPSILPLCHQLNLESVEVTESIGYDYIEVKSKVVAFEKTGVEMEALTATAAALLNIWDVVKQYEKDQNGQYPYTAITEIKVVSKVKENETT